MILPIIKGHTFSLFRIHILSICRPFPLTFVIASQKIKLFFHCRTRWSWREWRYEKNVYQFVNIGRNKRFQYNTCIHNLLCIKCQKLFDSLITCYDNIHVIRNCAKSVIIIFKFKLYFSFSMLVLKNFLFETKQKILRNKVEGILRDERTIALVCGFETERKITWERVCVIQKERKKEIKRVCVYVSMIKWEILGVSECVCVCVFEIARKI